MEAAWKFETANFEIRLEVLEEDTDPRETFEREEDISAIEAGEGVYFCARVSVSYKGRVIAEDFLGACWYNSVHEFISSHRDQDPMNRNCSLMRAARGGNVTICHYFPDMVAQAISQARAIMRGIRGVYIRTA
jgi:hypothetical protein